MAVRVAKASFRKILNERLTVRTGSLKNMHDHFSAQNPSLSLLALDHTSISASWADHSSALKRQMPSKQLTD